MEAVHGFFLPLRLRPSQAGAEEQAKVVWISHRDARTSDPHKLRDIFVNERASMSHWIMLALALRDAGRVEQFETILTEMEQKLDARGAGADEKCRGSIYAALALHNITRVEQVQQGDEEHTKRVDLANRYVTYCKKQLHFSWRIAMGYYHIKRFLPKRQNNELMRAREHYGAAVSMRPRSIIAAMYLANTFAMENQFQTAALYYTRALLLCKHIGVLITLRREAAQPLNADYECELRQMELQIKHLEALVLFALASCKFYEGDLSAAKSLVEKSLETEETSVALRLKAAVLTNSIFEVSNESDAEGSVPSAPNSARESMSSLIQQWNEASCKAYMLDPYSPLGQLHMCDLLFRRNRITECEARLEAIAACKLSTELQAEVAYKVARCAHALGDWKRAVTGYNNVLAIRTEYLPARIQLIKAYIGANDLTAAREQCDYLNQYNNKTPEVLRLSAHAYIASATEILEACRSKLLQAETNLEDIDLTCAMTNVQQDVSRLLDERLFKALGILEEALVAEPNDVHTMAYLIYCLEMLVTRGRENLAYRLREVYKRYTQLHGGAMSKQMRNNDAVMALKFREFGEAVEKLDALWEEIENSEDTSIAIKLTVQFNLALALEESGQYARAHKIYSTLTKEYPRYTAAWLRKSGMMFKRGDVEQAYKYLDQLRQHHERSLDPWLFKAHHLFTMGRFDECIDRLRKLFRGNAAAGYDAYANTLFACALIKRCSRGTFGSLPTDVVHYARAGLRRPGLCNFYAANCIAVYLAHEGQLKTAYECFGILLESLATTSHMKYVAHKNMGLFCAATALGNERRTENGNFDKLRAAKAQQHLQAALSLNKLDVNNHLVYARFTYDAQRLDECIQFLETCRTLFPNNIKILYNLVIALDAKLCKNMRNSDKLASATEVNKMLTQANFVKAATAHLISIHEEYTKMSKTHLQQIAARVTEKLIPHMDSALPQLEAAATAKQRTKGKHLELQLSIQHAHEAKRLEKEMEQQRAREAESALSEQLLKEASEIASELMYSRPTLPQQSGGNR
ncbi:tetratricopeptide repeat (TPR) domain containing protein, putative [Babesia bigemina]|uniref:Tetratricopeptide repeat (TPR) domain containing protein, putative n=1 Tax=Babesia bigemina TaxID=5866 RepID=A0A061DEU1_BABBI|nr:tetratricopeptide repeat (TPR) domain containing protein, putative [Babesia bigemina]CDR97870.1 tetratricopeptide repeat (TPR) domain containing protein, putative [Babesia bigemina]|eukprot:XP_012770056.1 tetratricopeptide repeat (TPR) domain containing protein, putative [Babesia bigemina]